METTTTAIDEMLAENERRNQLIQQTFNPLTGEGCLHQRTHVHTSAWYVVSPCAASTPSTDSTASVMA